MRVDGQVAYSSKSQIESVFPLVCKTQDTPRLEVKWGRERVVIELCSL